MWRTTVHQNGVALHYWGRKEKKTRAVKRKAEQNKRAFTGGKHGGVMETSSLFFLFMIFLFFFCFLVLVTHQREGQPVVFWGGFNAITHTYLTRPSSANLTYLPTTTSSNATTPNLSSILLFTSLLSSTRPASPHPLYFTTNGTWLTNLRMATNGNTRKKGICYGLASRIFLLCLVFLGYQRTLRWSAKR